MLFAALEVSRRSRDGVRPFEAVLLGTVTIGLSVFSGANMKLGRGQLLPASGISNEGLYLLQPATTVVCLTPAKLNGLTAILEPSGHPVYYEGVTTETNSGPVVAIRSKDGEVVLKSFPVSPEWLKQKTEGQTGK